MKKGMTISTIGYLLVALFLLLILTFIYFGNTGFFRKIYTFTDKMGITHLAKDVAEVEKNISESGYKLTPEEKSAEEQIRSVMNTMMEGIDACLKGDKCVCDIQFPQFPEGYAMRFTNTPDNKVMVAVFKYKERTGSDYDEDYQGLTGVHFVQGAVKQFNNTQVCLAVDLSEEWIGTDVAKIKYRDPSKGIIQLYWEDKITSSGSKLWATEAVWSFVFNGERDYRIYGRSGMPDSIYKTRDGSFCFFAERFGWDDNKLIDHIKCDEVKEEKTWLGG